MAYGNKRHVAATSHSRDVVNAVNGVHQEDARQVEHDLQGAIDNIERNKEVYESALAKSKEVDTRIATARERLQGGIQAAMWLGTALGADALAARREGRATSSDIAMSAGLRVELDRLDAPIAGLMSGELLEQETALQTALADRDVAKAKVKVADTQWARSLSVLNCETARGKHVLVMADLPVPKRKEKAKRPAAAEGQAPATGRRKKKQAEQNGQQGKKPATATTTGSPPANANAETTPPPPEKAPESETGVPPAVKPPVAA